MGNVIKCCTDAVDLDKSSRKPNISSKRDSYSNIMKEANLHELQRKEMELENKQEAIQKLEKLRKKLEKIRRENLLY